MGTKPLFVSYSIDLKRSQEIFDDLGKGAVKAQAIAEKDAIRKIHKLMKTEAKNMLALSATVMNAEFDKRVKLNLGARQIFAEGKQFSLRLFLKTQLPRVDRKRAGLKLKVYKKKGFQIFKGSFAAVGNNGNLQVFSRTGPGRTPLRYLSATGIVDMYKQEAFRESVTSDAFITYEKSFMRAARAIMLGYIK